MKQHYITFENEQDEEILDYHCSCAGERHYLMAAWKAGMWLDVFPAEAVYAYGWDYEPITPITPMMTSEETRRRSLVSGRFKPSGIDY